MKKVKNADSVAHTWCGQEIQPGDYYTIQACESSAWPADSQVMVDIANGILVVNDGENDFTDIAAAIEFISSNVPLDIDAHAQIEGVEIHPTTKALRVSNIKPEGSSTFLVSHDFCDPTTWWSESVRVTGETLETVLGLTYTSDHEHWIDLEHGKVMYEDKYAATYKPKIYVDGQQVTSGFTIDYHDGTVTFSVSKLGHTVTADYSYENGSDWIIAPTSGKILCILGAEVKFSAGVDFGTSRYVNFSICVSGIPVSTVTYKSVRDFIIAAMGSIGKGYQFGGLTEDFYVLPFPYVTSKNLISSQNTSIRIGINDDQPLAGGWAFMTASCFVFDE